jgi:hypothetical protein
MLDELIMLDQRKRALEAKLKSLLNRPPETQMGEPEEVVFRKIPFAIEEPGGVQTISNGDTLTIRGGTLMRTGRT